MVRTSRGVRAATLIVFEVASIVTLHAIGAADWLQIPWHQLADWLAQTPADESLPALVRMVALALAYWLAISTVLYALSRRVGVPGAIRAVEWATLPALRRIVDGTAALTLVAATVAGPAALAIAAEDPSPIVVEVGDEGLPIPPFVGGEDPQPAETLPHGVARVGWTPTQAEVPSPSARPNTIAVVDVPAQWTVAPGDNLWTIAEQHLDAHGTELPNLGDYWQRVVVANRDIIRSSNPDLIYPGEIVVLPAIAEAHS